MIINMVNFAPVSPEIELWKFSTFVTIRQKSAYLTEYLNNYWTDLHQHFSFGEAMYRDYETDVSFEVVQGK